MGMFDTIILDRAKEPVICPLCNVEEMTSFQTKELECILDEWMEGEANPRWDYPVVRQVVAYDYCPTDRKLIYQKFEFTPTGNIERIGQPFILPRD